MISKHTCPLCGGTLQAGETLFSADLGFGVVMVRHVPARVCGQCGEDWIDDAVAARLEDTVQTARLRHAVVDVSDWREGIAA
jgi:YgiT-type zinc finger domain-containing protein